MALLFDNSLFPLGQLVATSAVNFRMGNNDDFKAKCLNAVYRHSKGDFGLVSEEDANANMAELEQGCLVHGGGRVLSRYHTDEHSDDNEDFCDGDIFIQTYKEGGKIYTIIMLTEEY